MNSINIAEIAFTLIMLTLGILGIFIIMKINARVAKRLMDIRVGGFLPIIVFIIFMIGTFFHDFSDTSFQITVLYIVVFGFSFYISLIFKDVTNKDKSILWAMVKVGICALLVCVFFGLVYFSIYLQFGDSAFNGYIGVNPTEVLISFVYFSFVTFASIGYGDISPLTSFARVIVIFQSVLYFIITLYAFSAISIVREVRSAESNNVDRDDVKKTKQNRED